MGSHGLIRLLLVSSALAGSGWILHASAPVDRPDINALISQVGERVAAYYQRAQRLQRVPALSHGDPCQGSVNQFMHLPVTRS